MAIWDSIDELAKKYLGEDALNQKDLSRLSKDAHSVNNKNKPYSSLNSDISDIEVLPEYEFILKAVAGKCPAIFVTGKAGTGKSTLIRYLSAKLENCAVVAPTAIAATNVGGVTIHSFFNLPPAHIDPDELISLRAPKVEVLNNLKVLVIDEVSMVTPNIIDYINNILKKAKKSDELFGGIPIILVGDLLQLPPVISSREEAVFFTHRYKTPYFYSADVFSEEKVLPVHLKKIRRQEDDTFINALNAIRVNRNHTDAISLINKECIRVDHEKFVDSIYLVPTNAAANGINLGHLNELEGTAQNYDARVTGNIPLEKWKMHVSSKLALKEKARVVFMKNKNPLWQNGDIGEVVGLEDNIIKVRKLATGNIVKVIRETWEKYKYIYNYETRKIEKEVVGTFQQFPVGLGWAITIHKSQGMTLDKIVIDFGHGAFAEGQAYVALSRCKTIAGISLVRPLSITDVKADQTVIEFYKALGIE